MIVRMQPSAIPHSERLAKTVEVNGLVKQGVEPETACRVIGIHPNDVLGNIELESGYIPLPETIASECARIRSGWNDRETVRRTVGHHESRREVETPFIVLGDVHYPADESY